jgi:transposase InsO family protein
LDIGGEYTSNEFKDFYKDEGIKRDLTISDNPLLNGVAERKNQSVIGSFVEMVHDQEFHVLLWERACKMTMYS